MCGHASITYFVLFTSTFHNKGNKVRRCEVCVGCGLIYLLILCLVFISTVHDMVHNIGDT